MKCALIRWWMEEYSDGTLKGWRLRWVEKHLQECRACAQELAWHRELRDALKPTSLSAPPQDMWQDFQRKLAERRRAAPVPRIAWWQWGTATAAVACVLALGTVWWSGHAPVSERSAMVGQPGAQSIASGAPQPGAPATGGVENSAPSPTAPPVRSLTVKPTRTAQAHPAKPSEEPPLPLREAAQPQAQPTQERTASAPLLVASMAYAEVRNEQGELVGKVLVQTTYDENGQPRTVQIECDTPTAVEVESNDEPMDSPDTRGDNRGSAGSSTATAGTRPGLSD